MISVNFYALEKFLILELCAKYFKVTRNKHGIQVQNVHSWFYDDIIFILLFCGLSTNFDFKK